MGKLRKGVKTDIMLTYFIEATVIGFIETFFIEDIKSDSFKSIKNAKILF